MAYIYMAFFIQCGLWDLFGLHVVVLNFSSMYYFTGLDKKLIQIFLYHVTEKPERFGQPIYDCATILPSTVNGHLGCF